MNFLKRLRLLPAVLGVSATLAAVGTTLFGDSRPGAKPPAAVETARPEGGRFVDELAVTKFSKLPVLTYRPQNGDALFAWQMKPALAAPAPRPRDVLVLVDTTASQAGKPLKQARQVITALSEALGANDRVSVWSVSTPKATRALTKDFQAPDSDGLRDAAANLTDVEYGSGAADLKGGLEAALATMPMNRARHQVVLYLGDGESAFAPIGEADRIALGTAMDARDAYFFAVPLGYKLDAHNLHGLSALTGGAVVRVQEDLATAGKRAEFAARLTTALDVPVVKPAKWTFGKEVAELYPTKLPPLRADRATLVMGKLADPAAANVTATVKGLVNGKEIELTFAEPLPAPQVDNYFLNLMVSQWRAAPHKDAPAMLASDRALALASTQVQLYREEFLTQAVWAVSVDRLDEAEKLYTAALKVDPTHKEAQSGAALVAKMRSGKLTKAELVKLAAEKTGGTRFDATGARAVILDPSAAQPPAPPAGGTGTPPNPAAAGDLLKEAAARRQIEEQRYKVQTDGTIRRGRELLRTDPDAAYQDLKRKRDEVLAYDGIGDDARRQLVADLEAVMREVFVKGAEIKRQSDTERQALALSKQRLNEFERQQDQIAGDKNRIDQFRQLMKQARYELAYQEAQLMVQEKTVKGLPTPVTTTASYIIGQQATQLREWKELVRIREDRFLLAMMQTEKSHIPYPDEPPVHFPPAAVWRELTGLRRDAYLNSNLGPSPSETQKSLKNTLENVETQLRDGQKVSDLPLRELLDYLQKRHNVTFIVAHSAFEEGKAFEEKKPTVESELRGLKLGNFLDIVLLSMNATYIVRPEYIEITSFDRRLSEKVTRVFPVADLAVPIPNAVSQSQLINQLQFQNATLAIFGQASLFGGGLQNAGGNFNIAGGNNGGGPLGQMGGGGFGGQMAGFAGVNQNQGAGGGFTSFGGGQLGQFGNLGGQFGLQGGDQSGLLMQLIFETVAKGEWANLSGVAPMPGMGMDETTIVTGAQLNSLGYYPPARALVVRGTTRYYGAASIKLKKNEGMAAGNFNPKPGGGQVAGGPGAKDPNPAAVAAAKPTITDPKQDAVALRKKLSNDPKVKWSQAIDWTVTDPGLILATAEFLMEFDEPAAAAEVLKGNLRKGVVTDDWAHEALAVALQTAGTANPVEVERAAVSAIDLDPTSAKAYLKAASAMANQKNHKQAVTFCKRAAACSPSDPAPYANALAYAEKATGLTSDAVMWAADGLLKRDWTNTDGIDYHKETVARLPKIEAQLKAGGQNVATIAATIAEQNRRDLVIELLWQGNADLDLIVAEPTGSVCSSTTRRTTGGGALRADILEQQNDRSEVYTAASAFTGTYTVSAKQAFGRAVGGRAALKVTKFKGTPNEAVELIDLPLDGKSVTVKLDGGSRTKLAAVADEVAALDARAELTGAALTSGVSGFGGGAGAAGSVVGSAAPQLPVVASSTEKRMAGISSSAADIRATYKLNPDGKTFSITVNPVFSGSKGDIELPKVPLLPGAEVNR